jgi:lipoprotein-releasing system permease protein
VAHLRLCSWTRKPLRPFEIFVGLRYTRAQRRNHFISFISLISMLGIALGIAALITVLSVMNGFQREIRSRILGAASHIEVRGADGALANWAAVANDARQHPQVSAAAPYIMEQGMLSYEGAVQGALVRGVLPGLEETVVDIGAHMVSGSLSDLRAGEFGIVLGAELARSIKVLAGDKVTLIAPQGQVTPAGIVPRIKQFKVVGIFEIGMFEYDSGLALIHLEDAQKLYRLEGKVSGVRLKLNDLFEAPQVARDLTQMVSADAFISDWTRSHANYFRALAIEKRMLFIILLLIVAVAAFNIVSTLVMVVTDKQADIAILRTLGASPLSIMKIFIVQGMLIGLIGSLIGVVGGILLALNVDVVVRFIERVFSVQFLSKEVYYISELPSDLQWPDVIAIAGVSFALSLGATLYPSFRASRVKPAEALSYE